MAVEDTRSFEYVLMHDDDQMSPTTDSMCGGDHCALVEPASKRARTSEHRISGVYHKLNSNTGWVKDPELLTEARSHRDRQRQRRRKIFWEKKKKILDSWSDGHLRRLAELTLRSMCMNHGASANLNFVMNAIRED